MEDIDFADIKVNKDKDFDEQEISLDDLNVAFVAHPQVGQETGPMKVKRWYTTTDTDRVDKEGEKFSLALKRKDGKGNVAHCLETDRGVYTIASWEELGKLRAIAQKLKRTRDFTINVKHLVNGYTDKKAQKENRCYEIVLLE
jgi:hypothetical protein